MGRNRHSCSGCHKTKTEKRLKVHGDSDLNALTAYNVNSKSATFISTALSVWPFPLPAAFSVASWVVQRLAEIRPAGDSTRFRVIAISTAIEQPARRDAAATTRG